MRGLLNSALRVTATLVVASTVASHALAASAVHQAQYRPADDAFVVLTSLEGYAPEDHQLILGQYQQRKELIFAPVDVAVRTLEQRLNVVDVLQCPCWNGQVKGEMTSVNAEAVAKIKTRPGQLFINGDLLAYYQETVLPGSVVDAMLQSYRGPLMDKAAVDAEIARRDSGGTMKVWSEFRGLHQENPLQFLNIISLRQLSDAAAGDGVRWKREGQKAQTRIPMTDDDARDLKRQTEWWLAESRRTHSYQGQLLRGFASAYEQSIQLTPIKGKGLQITVNLPVSLELYSSQVRLQHDTRDGEVAGSKRSHARFTHYDSLRTLIDATPDVHVNWAVRDRDVLVKKYRDGSLVFDQR